MLTNEQQRRIASEVRSGLSVMHRPPPMRLSEWADENFYLSSESSYVEGRWVTEPFQRTIMDCMSNEDIRELTFIKSARVGYTKMLMAAVGYYLEHKKRNQLIYLPNDDPAKQFMRQHVEPMIRDVPAIKDLAPWFGKKDKASTEKLKIFNNGKVLHVRGGGAAKNYRELSVDVVIYDEMDGFDSDVESEGSPLTLGDKRIEGSVFPKSIRGSTPKLERSSIIKASADNAESMFRFHVPCPHCGELQHLKFGGRHASYGLKWHSNDPHTVRYMCEHCGALSTNAEMQVAQHDPRCRWQSDAGVWIDEECYFRAPSGEVIETPHSVAFHIWTAYSPWTTWTQIIREWLAAQGDITRLRTFTNTTLGEVWSEAGERADEDELASRVEDYEIDPLPEGIVLLTMAVDVQPDRLEVKVKGWGAGDESWMVDYLVIIGDPNQPQPWQELDAIRWRIYNRADGVQIRAARCAVDTGGANTQAVYEYCRTRFADGVIAIKGMQGEARPIIGNPSRSNIAKIPLFPVGVLTCKDTIFGRLKIHEVGPGYMHFRHGICDGRYFSMLTAEELKLKLSGGRTIRIYEKIAEARRNEALDLEVYNLAAYHSLNVRADEMAGLSGQRQERTVRGELVNAV